MQADFKKFHPIESSQCCQLYQRCLVYLRSQERIEFVELTLCRYLLIFLLLRSMFRGYQRSFCQHRQTNKQIERRWTPHFLADSQGSSAPLVFQFCFFSSLANYRDSSNIMKLGFPFQNPLKMQSHQLGILDCIKRKKKYLE